MTEVWKFTITYDDYTTTMLPKGAQILKFDMRAGGPTIWVRVEPHAPVEERRFRFAGTGHALADDVGAHLGTCFDGPMVWHLFAAG